MPPNDKNPRWLPVLLGLVSLLPLIANFSAFQGLFYFEDEIDQVHQFDQIGYLTWAFSFFGENWAPLFKLLWGGIVLTTGSYLVLVCAVWLTHALNVALLSRLLLRCGGGTWATVGAAVLLGLPWFNIETLGWSVQWLVVLAMAWLLAGLLAVTAEASPRWHGWRPYAAVFACSALGAVSSVRGVLTGIVLAAVALGFERDRRSLGQRLTLAACALLPTLVVGTVLAVHNPGSQSANSANLGGILHYGFAYFALSPLRWLCDAGHTDLLHLVPLAAIKVALLVLGVALAPARLRSVAIGLILYELANSALLGLGRFHTGLGTAASSRYQYMALATAAPVAVVGLAALWRRWGPQGWPGAVGAALACAALAVFVARPWARQMAHWQSWRGEEFRAALALPPNQAPPNFSQLPWISNERARALCAKYSLH